MILYSIWIQFEKNMAMTFKGTDLLSKASNYKHISKNLKTSGNSIVPFLIRSRRNRPLPKKYKTLST